MSIHARDRQLSSQRQQPASLPAAEMGAGRQRQSAYRAGPAAHTGHLPGPDPKLADQAIVDLAAGDGHHQDAYMLTAAGPCSLS